MGFMSRVLESPRGKALYRKRSVMIEPVFGHIKPRLSRVPLGMATDHRDAQPSEAPRPPPDAHGRLNAARALHPVGNRISPTPIRRPDARAATGFAQQPPR